MDNENTRWNETSEAMPMFPTLVWKIQLEADTINFHDPRNQTSIIRPPVVELKAENTDQVVVTVKDARCSFFWRTCSIPSRRARAKMRESASASTSCFLRSRRI
jgi:hypothetical protein